MYYLIIGTYQDEIKMICSAILDSHKFIKELDDFTKRFARFK